MYDLPLAPNKIEKYTKIMMFVYLLQKQINTDVVILVPTCSRVGAMTRIAGDPLELMVSDCAKHGSK